MFNRILIIGCGLIGSSILRASLSKKVAKKIFVYEISKKITLTPSLYLETGAIHGCAIIHNNKPLIYMEDVGRHNAVDKIAGFMFLKKILRIFYFNFICYILYLPFIIFLSFLSIV